MKPLFRPIFIFCLLISLFLVFGLFYLLTDKPLELPAPPVLPSVNLSEPFEQEIAAYAAIDRGPLKLKDDSLSSFSKKLQKKLHYYGPNNRPDGDKNTLFLGLKAPFTVKEKTPLYLSIDKQREMTLLKTKSPGGRCFLTVESTASGPLLVKLFALPSGQPLGDFKLPLEKTVESENPLFAHKPGKQVMRLVGRDLFLERHGGESYAYTHNKERLDFGSADNPGLYFVSPGDFLVYEQGAWREAPPLGEKTEKSWLMQVDSLDDRGAHLTLWAPIGDQKYPLHLPRVQEGSIAPPLDKTFKYLGAKTAHKWLFEVQKERVLITPGSWWLFRDKEWQELVTDEELDSYVNGLLTGELLVFDDMVIEDEGKYLQGHLFNRLRNQVKEVKLPIQ